MAKAIAWWLALCGKVGVKSVSRMLWGKFPHVCPYCRRDPHDYDECMARKAQSRGPDWSELAQIGRRSIDRQPRTIAEWQQMFAKIYPGSTTEEYSKTFAKLAEEVGELAEALRVFPEAPGYFLSEAADVFAWLMKLNNMVEGSVARSERGLVLQRTLADAYPARCRDCNSAICTCPPILATTKGRIAHEVPNEFVSYAEQGSFYTADRLSQVFGHSSSPEAVKEKPA
jgi:NTP pyrophosphatase (non-canonical NTP hydrolase)